MTNMTLSIPKEVHQEMKQYKEIKWSEVARQAIIARLKTLKFADELAKKSKLSEKDVQAFNKLIKTEASRRFAHDAHNT